MAKQGGVGGKLSPKKPKDVLLTSRKFAGLVDVTKLPKDLGKCVEIYALARRERKRREAEVEDMKSTENAVEEHILKLFTKAEIEGVKTSAGTVSLKEKDVPRITDFEALCKHIKKTDSWDLLQRRAGEAACQSRWEAGEEIPGVEKFHNKKLSLTESK